MGIIRYVLENAKCSPDKTAIIIDDEAITYRECVELTRKLSGALASTFDRDDLRIGLTLNNSLEFVITLLAAADLGATVIPLNNTISAEDLDTAVRATGINCLVAQHTVLQKVFESPQDERGDFLISQENCVSVGGDVSGCHDFSDIVETAPAEYTLGNDIVDDEQDFILTMTSGSTSAPKPIVFTQGTKIRRCFNAQEVYRLTDQDIILVATPLYHSISQRLVLTPLILGGTCVIMRKFTPAIWLEHVEARKVSFTIAVASQLDAIASTNKNIAESTKSLHAVVSCCALLGDEAKKRVIEKLNCDVHECYGASEVGVVSNLSNTDPSTKVHTVGRAVSGVDIRIVNSENQIVPSGVIGEITCKSIMRFSRYYKNQQATDDSILDGYFFTGDMGYLDEDGYLVFSGRKKEVIITGGANVFPKDIEGVLNQHPDVSESAVIGVPDKQFGEAVLALVIKTKGASLSERDLQRHCLHRLADVQKPLAYLFVDDFPRTALGKVIKHKLSEQYADFDATANLRAIIEKRDETPNRKPL